MTKKKRALSVRKSNLLYFANEAKLKTFDGGRLLDKKEKNYTAVIARVLADAGEDGLQFEKLVANVGKIVKHKNEKTLRLNIRWYLSSKRSDVAKFVTSKRVENDAIKAAGPASIRAKRARKSRTTKSKSNGAEISDSDIPRSAQQEMTA